MSILRHALIQDRHDSFMMYIHEFTRFLSTRKDVNSPGERGQASVHHLGQEKDNTHLYTRTNRP